MKRNIAKILAVVVTTALMPGCRPSTGEGSELWEEIKLGSPVVNSQFMKEGFELRRRVIPSHAFRIPQDEQLVLVWQGPVRRHLNLTIESLKDLSDAPGLSGGYVDLDTEAKALSYVRLTTGSGTCGLLREWQGWEVLAAGLCGDAGKIEEPILREAGWEPPRIKQRPGGWVIVRYIAKISKQGGLNPDQILRVAEEVTKDGEYKTLSETVTYSGHLGVRTVRKL